MTRDEKKGVLYDTIERIPYTKYYHALKLNLLVVIICILLSFDMCLTPKKIT